MSYAIEFSNRAAKGLRGLAPKVRKAVKAKIGRLAENPSSMVGVKKLSGSHGVYRLRVGEYRVLYTIEHQRLVILVVGVGPRGSIYKTK